MNILGLNLKEPIHSIGFLFVILLSFGCSEGLFYSYATPVFCYESASNYSGYLLMDSTSATVSKFGDQVSGVNDCSFKLNLVLEHGAEITVGVDYESYLTNATMPSYQSLQTGETVQLRYVEPGWNTDELTVSDSEGIIFYFEAARIAEDEIIALTDDLAQINLQQGEQSGKARGSCGTDRQYLLDVDSGTDISSLRRFESTIVQGSNQKYQLTNVHTGSRISGLFADCEDIRGGHWIDFMIVRLEE